MLDTAPYLSMTNPFNLPSNSRGAPQHLCEQITTLGRVDLALAAYNAWPERAGRYRSSARLEAICRASSAASILVTPRRAC